MRLNDYFHDVMVPAHVAVSALRRAGLPVDRVRVQSIIAEWETEIARLEKFVEGEAQARGFASLKYSEAHALPPKGLRDFLFSARGLGLEVKGKTPTGLASADDHALAWYASLSLPRDTDHPVVQAILQIRSLSKGKSTHLENYLVSQRTDGCVHPQFNWALRTARLSAEKPPVHQIPERADKRVADAIKSCFVPRINPPPSVDDWDPRIHGSCFRWDISGAEAAIRAGMLTHRFCSKPDPAWEYIRLGKDVHARTAALLYGKPEGTFKKGDWERDATGKVAFFAKQYGATWRTLQSTVWEKARIWLPDDESRRMSDTFDAGYPGLTELYEHDKISYGRLGYCEDGFGRRRWIGFPDGVRFRGVGSDGTAQWDVQARTDDERKSRWGRLEHNFHVTANTPTQSMSAIDGLWMLALLYHGEYVDLKLPEMWEARGLLYPETKDWQIHEGKGPGGKPFLAWHGNTVHDSGWGDCAPGYVEPLAKLVYRRCTAVPFDWRIQADLPYRVEVKVGPNQASLLDYNKIAKRFGLEPLPEL